MAGVRVETEDDGCALRGAPVPFERLDGGGLASAVGPQERGLAAPRLEGQVVDRGQVVVADDQVAALHGHVRHGAEATVGRTMIDIRLVREHPDSVKAALARRGVDPAEIDELRRRTPAPVRRWAGATSWRARVKELSRHVGAARKAGDDDRAGALSDESRRIAVEEKDAAEEAEACQEAVRRTLLVMPNLPAQDAPDGAGPEDNRVVRRWPEPAPLYGEHQRRPHWDVGRDLGILDLEGGARLAGSMFPMFHGIGSALLRALERVRSRPALGLLRGGASTDAGANRDDGVDRPLAEVLGRGVPHRA